MSSQGKGKVKLNLPAETFASDVMYTPNAAANLLSVGQIADKGHIIVFDNKGAKVYDKNEIEIKGKIKFTGSKVHGIYKLDQHKLNQKPAALMNSTQTSHELWHKRMGHISFKNLCRLRDGLAHGISFKDKESIGKCISCIEGKQTRLSFPKGTATRATEKLQLIHTDLCGPMSEPSWGGAKYLLMFTDDFTRKTFCYFLKTKNEVFRFFKDFKALVEKQTGLKIKRLRSDNGTEYCNGTFKAYLKNAGIIHETTVPYAPEQNGVSERANRTVIEKARTMLIDSGLSKKYWAEAVSASVYLKNRSPSAAIKDATPEELWTKKKVDISHLRIFGCIAYAHIPKNFRKKLDSKSEQMIMIGYCESTKGYRLVKPNDPNKLIKRRDVIFLEDKMYYKILLLMTTLYMYKCILITRLQPAKY